MGVATGIDELHNLHHVSSENSYIVHGDIKPANVLLSHHIPSFVKLADFGLSELMKKSVESGPRPSTKRMTATQKGTLFYSAPELLPDVQNYTAPVTAANRKSDMYSFAILMWEVLTGLRAFKDFEDKHGKIYESQLSYHAISY